MTEALCRPDDKHFCIECCQGRKCVNLGKLNDQSMGCLGHDGKGTIEGSFPQTPACRNFDCLEGRGLSKLEISKLHLLIKKQPAGQFQMSKMLEILNKEPKS